MTGYGYDTIGSIGVFKHYETVVASSRGTSRSLTLAIFRKEDGSGRPKPTHITDSTVVEPHPLRRGSQDGGAPTS